MWKRKKKAVDPVDPQKAVFNDDTHAIFDEWSQYKVTDADTGTEYLDMSFEDFEISEMNKSRVKKKADDDDGFDDKIFGNSYNSGDVQMSRLPEIKVRADYAGRLDCYNADNTHYVRMEMSKRVNSAFEESQWSKLVEDKEVGERWAKREFKLPKNLIPYVFNDLFLALDDGHSSTTDRFIVIAEFLEFMHVSYDKVYSSVPVRIKESLLQELDDASGNITGKRIVRLF
jgi:hypothetical protein